MMWRCTASLLIVVKLAFLVDVDREDAVIEFARQIEKIDSFLSLLLKLERLPLQLL